MRDIPLRHAIRTVGFNIKSNDRVVDWAIEVFYHVDSNRAEIEIVDPAAGYRSRAIFTIEKWYEARKAYENA